MKNLFCAFFTSVFVFSFFFFNLGEARAQESLTLSVTPPLIQLTIGPGEFWASELKVVNTNSFDLKLYATVMNFEASGEEGKSKFVPATGASGSSEPAFSLAGWIEVPKDPVLIPAGQSGKIPFSVRVPQDAEPGGHYAAILIGNQPAKSTLNGPTVNISSFVSSLLFLRVPGDVTEEGRIREFSSEKILYQTPEADFTLRFENTGNVHVLPQGTITIYNMWGKERGKVLVNQDSNFGNVMPQSTRKFEFTWTGEGSIFEIGRYTAIATLAYGENGRKNVSASTYFWVVPIVPAASVFGCFLLFILSVTWFIRRYIRRALSLEKELLGLAETETDGQLATQPTIETLVRPIKQGVIDLRNIKAGLSPIGHGNAVSDTVSDIKEETKPLTFWQFLKKYKLFFLFLVIIVLAVVFFLVYFGEVLLPTRGFHIEIKDFLK